MADEQQCNSDDLHTAMSSPPDRSKGHPVTDRVATLVERWLDGVIEPTEIAEMEAAIRESSEARQVFWARGGLHGMLHEAARIKFAELPASEFGLSGLDAARISMVQESQPVSNETGSGETGSSETRALQAEHASGALGPRLLAWPRWPRPNIAAASVLILVAGGAIGWLATSLAVAHVDRELSEQPRPVVVVSEGFETPPSPNANYLPKVTDCWSGDETCVVGPDARGAHGVQPRSGDCMLQFVSGHPRGETYPGIASEIWRFVALDQLRTLAGSQEIRVEFSAWFNTAAVAGHARPVCGLRAIATELAPGEVDQRTWLKQSEFGDLDEASVDARPAAIAQIGDRLDRDPATWQRVAAVVAVPAHARYLLLHCYVRDRSEVPYAGADRSPVQYVDDIAVTVEPMPVPRPSRGQRAPSTVGAVWQ